jgi:hypothetical protein
VFPAQGYNHTLYEVRQGGFAVVAEVKAINIVGMSSSTSTHPMSNEHTLPVQYFPARTEIFIRSG